MKKILTQYGGCALAAALMAADGPGASVTRECRAALPERDAGTLSDKFTGLARVMAAKYDWKPGQGVRSVGDVFNLIVTENGVLVGVLSGTPNTGPRPAPITDPDKLQEALWEGFHVQSAKGDYGTFRQRPARRRVKLFRKRHDEAEAR